MSRKQEIIICEKCKGKGIVYFEELVCHHNGDYIIHSRDCKHCENRGVIMRITSIEMRPLHQQEYNPCQTHNGEYKYDRNE